MLAYPTPLQTATDKVSNFAVEVTYKDFAAGVVNTALAINLFTILAKYMGAELKHYEVTELFQDTADAAHVSTSITIGDAGSANRLLTASELNANGTYVPLKAGTGTLYIPTSDTVVTLTVTPTAAKNVASLNKGKVILYFRVPDARVKV